MKRELLIGAALLAAALGCAVWFFVSYNMSVPQPVVQGCTMEALICPDGSAVGRTGPNCEFAACPSVASSTTSSTAEGKFCGGIAAFPCPSGYVCKLDGSFPDAGGRCTNIVGTLRGKVTIGPICPVERPGVMCAVPIQAYTSRTVIIYDASGKNIITQENFNPDGTYSFILPTGKYTVNIPLSGGLGRSGDLPQLVSILSGQTTTLNFSIDTGIR